MRVKPNPNLQWAIPLAAVELIAEYETLRLRAYRCPAGVPTIGWGQTEGVCMGMEWSRDQADADLCRSIMARAAAVKELCTREPSPHELGAMVSLSYNIGHGAFARSTVLRAHNAGDALSASRAFGLFNKARLGGTGPLVELAGLTARRAAEGALYLQPEPGAPSLRMPQAVEPSESLVRSPTAQSGTLALAAGSVSIVAQADEHIGTASTIAKSARGLIVDTLGIPASWVLPALLVLFGGIAVWNRIKQRVKGWA